MIPPMIMDMVTSKRASGSSSGLCHVFRALVAWINMLYGTTVVPIMATQVIIAFCGTFGTAPISSSPRSGFTIIMVTTNTIAITLTQTLKSFSRVFTASPILMRIRTPIPQIGATMLEGIPVREEMPIAVPVRSPPIYATPPSTIAEATRIIMAHLSGGRSESSFTSSSASPFWVTIPRRAAISCITITAITEKITVQRSAYP